MSVTLIATAKQPISPRAAVLVMLITMVPIVRIALRSANITVFWTTQRAVVNAMPPKTGTAMFALTVQSIVLMEIEMTLIVNVIAQSISFSLPRMLLASVISVLYVRMAVNRSLLIVYATARVLGKANTVKSVG